MPKSVAIIGGGPAGLIAAETLVIAGFDVHVYERKASLARKFLMAGRGGLNLTHSEHRDDFVKRYGSKSALLSPIIDAFTPQMLRDWCHGLGQETFVGSSGRVFPKSFKTSPLLRAWIKRLEERGVHIHLNHQWTGWDDDNLVFQTQDGCINVKTDATLLALGGASWPRLGSDATWIDILKPDGIEITPLEPANCGFHVAWSPLFRQRFAGQPLKSIAISIGDHKVRGEAMITYNGIEGGAIYALSRFIREMVNRDQSAHLTIDLKPDLDHNAVAERLKKPRQGKSLSNFLSKTLSLSPVAIGLLMERPDRSSLGQLSTNELASIIKNYPLAVGAPFNIDGAISSAGGISFDAIDNNFMLHKKPGVFVAGEMLDWEAPTGGFLLQASFATGIHAAKGIIDWLK